MFSPLPAATRNAIEVDYLLWGLILMSFAILALVFGLMLFFVVRYRAASSLRRGDIAQKTWRVETTWTAATLVAFLCLDVWGANLFIREFHPPAHVMKIYVVGKQWMWKIEYPGGQREINHLHLPLDRDIELLLVSEDVIHDFGVPSFRLRHDVLPGRYETLWFHTRRPGTYPFFCDQFCGTDHASMIGDVTVMSGPAYQRWLEQNGTSETLAAQGHALFIRYGCSGCHRTTTGGGEGTVRAPPLTGVYGSPVPLSDGTVVTADDKYIRDSILMPGKQIVASYQNLMPSFAGQISEEDLVKIIAYIKSLGSAQP